MKIAYVVTRLNQGGVTEHLVNLISETDKHFDNYLISGYVDNEVSASINADINISIIKSMRRNANLFLFYKSTLECYNLFKSIRPDVVSTHTSLAGVVGRVAAFLYKKFCNKDVKILHTYHGHVFSGYFNFLISYFIVIFERVMSAVTDVIVVLNELQRCQLVNQYKIASPSKFIVIPLSVPDFDCLEIENLRRTRAELGFYIFGIVGRLALIKNHESFINAALISKNKKVLFNIIGGGDLAYEKKLRSLAVADKRVCFLGAMDSKVKIFSSIDCLVVTSKNEGTPMVILEAFKTRTPVISTPVGGVPDMLSDGRGILIDKDCVELVDIFDNPEQISQLDLSLPLNYVKNFHSSCLTSAKYIEMYKSF